jgi:hypothetical protein
MKKNAPIALSQTAESRVAEIRRSAKRKAAQICLEQTFPLVGTDLPFRGLTAECVSLAAAKERFSFVTEALLLGASEASLRELVMGEGEHGSDRLCALWWASLRFPARFWREEQIEENIKSLHRPIPDLVQDNWLFSDALNLTERQDPSYWKREASRKEHAEFQARLLSLAKEKE